MSSGKKVFPQQKLKKQYKPAVILYKWLILNRDWLVLDC